MKRFAGNGLAWLTALCLTAFSSAGQGVVVRASVDTASIRIGEQFRLSLEMTAPAIASVRMPALLDTVDAFEIVGRSKTDTVDNKNNTLTYRQQLQLTCFDTGYYVIQPLTFLYKDARSSSYDSAATEPLLVTVTTVAVDTTVAIKDIKPPMEVPWTIWDALPWILAAAAAVLLIFLVRRWMASRRKAGGPQAPKAPPVPAHVTALQALETLAGEKLWQQGHIKLYHTRLSDIVRTYLEGRFTVLAMEQTTDEILHALAGRKIPEDAMNLLRDMLRLADLVKFAKVQPVAPENEQSFLAAREFVLATKPVTADDFDGKEAAS